MNITLNPLRKAPDSLQCPSGEGPKRPSFFQRAVALVLCAALFGGVAGGSLFCPLPVPIAAQACCPPARSRASDPHRIKISPAQKYIPRQPRDHIKKAPSRVSFCLGKMVRSDRLECGRKSEVKETAWWEGRSVQIGKGVPDNPQKAGSAARALAAGSRNKRDFLRKRRKAGAV